MLWSSAVLNVRFNTGHNQVYFADSNAINTRVVGQRERRENRIEKFRFFTVRLLNDVTNVNFPVATFVSTVIYIHL